MSTFLEEASSSVEIIMGIKVDFATLKFCASATIISFLSTNNSHQIHLASFFCVVSSSILKNVYSCFLKLVLLFFQYETKVWEQH